MQEKVLKAEDAYLLSKTSRDSIIKSEFQDALSYVLSTIKDNCEKGYTKININMDQFPFSLQLSKDIAKYLKTLGYRAKVVVFDANDTYLLLKWNHHKNKRAS